MTTGLSYKDALETLGDPDQETLEIWIGCSAVRFAMPAASDP